MSRPRPIAGLLALGLFAPAPLAQAQALRAPDGWVARPERFVEMPPGWHITAGRGVILYNEATASTGQFRVESEGYLFDPEGRNGTYGLIFGGRDLDSDAQRYVAFEIDTQGRFAVRRHDGHESAELVPPTVSDALRPWTGEDATVKNVLGVDVGPATVKFVVNGATVAELPRADVGPDGVLGFRIDAGVNIHVTTLDVTSGDATQSWAPERPDS